jgi:hypothetical protein
MSLRAKFIAIRNEFNKISEKHRKELEESHITPIHPEYPYAQNGIWAMIATMGSGKSYNFLLQIADSEVLYDEPFFERAVICSTSAGFDRTVKRFKEVIKKTKLETVEDSKLLEWLNAYIEKYKLYNTIMEFVSNNLKDPSDEMRELIETNNLYNKKKLLEYIAKTLTKIGWKQYPSRCLLILDDFASHPLLKHKEFPLPSLLKKIRHFHINVVVCVQTTMDIPRDVKRNLSDCVIFPGISYDDFKDLFKGSSLGFVDADTLWKEYIKISDQRTMIRIHVKARRVIITPPAS